MNEAPSKQQKKITTAGKQPATPAYTASTQSGQSDCPGIEERRTPRYHAEQGTKYLFVKKDQKGDKKAHMNVRAETLSKGNSRLPGGTKDEMSGQ